MKQTMLLIFIIILISVRCDTTEPPNKASLMLTLEDVSCTEAWPKLTTTDIPLPASILLKQNDAARATINLTTADTLLYVDSLLPKQTYVFQVSHIVAGSNQYPVSSNKANVTTLDTTSHNFTWQTFTFGEHSSSTLYDVAIINENNIWAVGEIYMKDSLGQPDPTFYNAVHWNGTDWELKRIFYKGGIWSIRTLFAFNENDIWFSGYMRYLNGQFIELPIPSILMGWGINKLWGNSSNDLYAVGNSGNIAHWDGVKWSKIESGTSLILADIIGVPDDNSNYNKYLAAGDAMLVLDRHNSVRVINLEQNMFVNLLWGQSNSLIYTAGNGVVLYKNYKWEKFDSPDMNTVYGIRGSNYNNIFGLSSTLSILHFNGYSWRDIYTGGINIYYRLEVKNHFAVTVGWQGDKAALTLLNKN